MLIRIIVTEKGGVIRDIFELKYSVTKQGYLNHGVSTIIEEMRKDMMEGWKMELSFREGDVWR